MNLLKEPLRIRPKISWTLLLFGRVRSNRVVVLRQRAMRVQVDLVLLFARNLQAGRAFSAIQVRLTA